MKLFRAKKEFIVGGTGSISQTRIFEGQLFTVEDETKLPDPREKYPGNLKPFYEEIVPNSIIYRSLDKLIKTKEL